MERQGMFKTSEEYNAFYKRIELYDPGWQDAFVGLIQQYYLSHPVGGSLHIVLDDGNWERHHIHWCAGYACGKGDDEGDDLAELLLSMNPRQLKCIEDRQEEW